MLIKNTGLHFKIHKNFPLLYVLVGQEFLQIDSLSKQIKNTWQQRYEDASEIKVLEISKAADWSLAKEEAYSYSLFAKNRLLLMHYDKKTLDAPAQHFLKDYLANPNADNLLLLQAPYLQIKSLDWLININSVQLIYSTTPTPVLIKQWLALRLSQMSAAYDATIPALIYQYNEGNLQGCEQALKMLALICEKDQALNLDAAKEQLHLHCNYPLFDLADTCLKGDSIKALLLLEQAKNDKVEPTLILWILHQTISTLLDYLYLSKKSLPQEQIAKELKIWSNRLTLYFMAAKKFNFAALKTLLIACNHLEMQIKSSEKTLHWQGIDYIALSLCLGKKAY